MPNWNPDAPDSIGLQFPPRQAGSSPGIAVASSTVAAAQRLDPTVTESIDQVCVYLEASVSGPMLWEALHAGQEALTDRQVTTFAPNASPARQTVRTNGYGTGSGVWQALLDPDDRIVADWEVADDGWVEIEFATAAALAGRRILAAYLVLGTKVSGMANRTITAESSVNGTRTTWGSVSPTASYGDPPQSNTFFFGELHPTSGQPWTVAEVQAFDGPNSRFRFTFGGVSGQLWSASLVVVHAAENRQARAQFTVAANSRRWRALTPATPAGVANWAKTVGQPATLVVRRPVRQSGAAAQVVLPYLETADPEHPLPNVTAYESAAVTATTSGPPGSPSNIGSVTLGTPSPTRLMPMYLRAGATQSADSVEFVRAHARTVTAATTIEQDLQAVADQFGGIQFPVMPDTTLGYPDDLTIHLRRRSDDALIATAVVTADHAVTSPFTPGSAWRLVTAMFDVTSTLLPEQHYLRFSTTAGTWTMPQLDPYDGHSMLTGTGEQTYGGLVDRGWLSGVATYGDFPVLMFTAPDSVTGFAAAASSLSTGAEGVGCPVESIGYVSLGWTSTAMGADFMHYEVQRRDDVDAEWQPIAVITDEAVDEFADVEARLGVESCYRIRAVRTDGIGSAWSAESCATAPVDGCALTFTSNEAPEMSVAYADTYDRVAERDYDFPEADEVVTRRLYGRDFQVAFRPLERRGVRFSRNLLVRAAVADGVVGPPAVDALRELAAATLSYVTVRDEAGNRWLGSITVPELRVRQPAGFHWVTLTFVETTATPSTPDATP